MKEVLIFIGGFTVTISVGFVIIVLIDCVKELSQKLTLKHKQKHRFDKKPTAKCYCIDCTCYDTETGKCYRLNRNTADCWFCCDAELRKKELKEND